ncbi:uncharacterized protein LOC121737053 [Aricia agestis]|uniref:uncharacterized protein LOC121737053 n=1 Tax=Aricia agestis TaxID=91739 RepID=UPI001C20B058|nr:uncharacterized protein LOC121737053 [Aricia agestis]
MNNAFTSKMPESKKVGVWAEGSRIEAKEYVIPKKSAESIDDIPTIPDLDDLQDILEKEVTKAPVAKVQDSETATTLAEVGGIRGTIDGVEAALEVLMSFVPEVEEDDADTVWTIDSLLTQLSEKNN